MSDDRDEDRDEVEFDEALTLALAASAGSEAPSPDVKQRLMGQIRAASGAVDTRVGVSGHATFGEWSGAYVLGALTGPDRAAFEAHMASCVACTSEVRSLLPVTEALAHAAAPAEPSPSVRKRLLDTVGGRSFAHVSYNVGWLAAAASVLIALGLGVYAMQLRGRVARLESDLIDASRRAETSERLVAEARRDAGEARITLAVLVAPDLARIDLKGQPVAPSASARAFWSRSRGLVFAASNLPPAPAGRVYQLWVLTAQPAPIGAGLMKPDADGRVSATFNTPPDIPQPIAMAVTLEPDGGVPSPTGQKYLVGAAN